jgi:hypothetical protein
MSQKKEKQNRLSNSTKQDKLYKQWIHSICSSKLRFRIRIINSILRGMKQKLTHTIILLLILSVNTLIWIGVGGLIYHFFIKK